MIAQLNDMGDTKSTWTFEFNRHESGEQIKVTQTIADAVIHWFEYHEGYSYTVERQSFLSDSPLIKLTVKRA